MTNVFYQTAVQELESVLSPRVVSRSLKEGLRQHGRSPETADLAIIEQILKAQVYRQLQVTMPVTEAKDAVSNIVDRLRELDPDSAVPEAGATGGLVFQGERLERLQEALKPFNLYFEWPEVQKLRAQIQLLESEHDAGRESQALGEDAEVQLELVMQKLEDQLVLQARELGELREALEDVRSLGGPKVRRLETFVHQVSSAQDSRHLAPAEIERARRLARDLRKLMESSVYSEQQQTVDQPLTDLDAGTHDSPERSNSPFSIHTAAGDVSQPETEPTILLDVHAGSVDLAAALSGGTGTGPEEPEQPLGDRLADSSTGAGGFGARPDGDVAADVAGEATVDEGAAVQATAGESSGTFSLDPHEDLEGIIDIESEDEELLSIDTSQLDPEVSQRLRLLDLASELHDISQLENEHAELFNYQPALAGHLAELRAEVEADRSVAEVLLGLRRDLDAATVVLRDDLREELDEISASLEAVRPELETSELSQAVRVTLGILSTSLPSLADVEHVRQLKRLLAEQDESLQRSESALADQLRGQDELLARLEGTLVRYEAEPSAGEDVRQLRDELESLRLAHETRTLAPEVMAAARQVEERIARALAERATEASDRRRARLEALRAQLESLPVTQTLADRSDAARREIDRLLDQQIGSEAAGALLLDDPDAPFGPELSLTGGDDDLDALDGLLDGLRKEAHGSIQRRLQELAGEAGEIGSTRLADRIQAALGEIEEGRFPDLAHLVAAVVQEREAVRLEQIGELHRLTRAFTPFQGFDDERVGELSELLAAQKRRLDAGAPTTQIERAAGLLEALSEEAASRVNGMPQRLDSALERFEEVARLNSEDVATVRRILTHLDSQRGSLQRVSVGLRLQLESSLSQSEALLDSLEEEYEATRVIAEELVSEGLLDGVLGLFGDGSAAAETAGEEATAFDAEGLCGRYAAVAGVDEVVVISADGEMLAASGDVARTGGEVVADHLDANEAAVAGRRLEAAGLLALRDAGRGLVDQADTGVEIGSFEAAGSYVVVGFAADGTTVGLRLDSSALVPVMIGRLRRDLSDLDA